MKRLLFTILFVFLIATIASPICEAKALRDTTEVDLRVVHGGAHGGGNRSIDAVDLKAAIVEVSNRSYLVVTICRNLGGFVDYNISNDLEGISISGSVIAIASSYPVQLPEYSGYYTVEFILPDGTEYYGDFWL